MHPLPTDRPLSQGEIEKAIAELVNEMDLATHEYAQALRAAAVADADYKSTRAKRVLGHMSGPLPDIGKASVSKWANDMADSDDDIITKLHAHRMATGVADAIKDAQYSRRSALSALQTLAANVRAVT